MDKKLFILYLICAGIGSSVCAQVPYFAGTAGDGNLYGYTSLKYRTPADTTKAYNTLETYTTFQYGITDYFATGMDLYTCNNQVYWGVLIRGGYKVNQWFGVGLQATPSFDLTDKFKFSYATIGLYMNGALIPNGNFFWCSNTWASIARDGSNSFSQWWYLGYCIDFGKHGSLTPMVGCTHSWKFDEQANLAAGFYYSYGYWNFYAWGNDFIKANPRVVVGIDFCIPAKRIKDENK